MRTFLSIIVMLAGAVWLSPVPAKAIPQPMPGIAAAKFAPIEDVGYRRRYYRRNGYTAPYAYYPPYGYYPPPAYTYYAPAYPAYPYYAPYHYYRPYYSPYY